MDSSQFVEWTCHPYRRNWRSYSGWPRAERIAPGFCPEPLRRGRSLVRCQDVHGLCVDDCQQGCPLCRSQFQEVGTGDGRHQVNDATQFRTDGLRPLQQWPSGRDELPRRRRLGADCVRNDCPGTIPRLVYASHWRFGRRYAMMADGSRRTVDFYDRSDYRLGSHLPSCASWSCRRRRKMS